MRKQIVGQLMTFVVMLGLAGRASENSHGCTTYATNCCVTNVASEVTAENITGK